MKNSRKSSLLYSLIIGLTILLSISGCSNDSNSNDSSTNDNNNNDNTQSRGSYSLTLINRTAGFLADVMIDTRVCGDMDPDETCKVIYNEKPYSIRITVKSNTNMGELTNSQAQIFTPGDQDTETINMNLDSQYFSLWIKNENTSGYIIDAIGINWDGSSYEVGWNLANDITNDGYSYWKGFYDRFSTYNIHLLDVNAGKTWIFSGTLLNPGEDEYGTYSITLISLN